MPRSLGTIPGLFSVIRHTRNTRKQFFHIFPTPGLNANEKKTRNSSNGLWSSDGSLAMVLGLPCLEMKQLFQHATTCLTPGKLCKLLVKFPFRFPGTYTPICWFLKLIAVKDEPQTGCIINIFSFIPIIFPKEEHGSSSFIDFGQFCANFANFQLMFIDWAQSSASHWTTSPIFWLIPLSQILFLEPVEFQNLCQRFPQGTGTTRIPTS